MDRREFLFQRKNRCVGQLLDRLEREIFPKLTEQEQDLVRKLVKIKIAAYHTDVIDLVAASGDELGINALAMKEKDKRR